MITCEQARESLPLLGYGELGFDAEEALEAHCAVCPRCAAERVRFERLDGVLAHGEAAVPPGLLARCRGGLAVKIQEEAGLMRRFAPRRLWRGWFLNPPVWLRPAGAIALLAIGFFSARFVPSPALPGFAGRGEGGPVASRVRFVRPDEAGRIRLVMEETRQREITGHLEDEFIRQALLAAAMDPADPGLRVESMELLKHQGQQDDVRAALTGALRGDPNSGVRLKALEGLKAYAREPEVRAVLAQVLLNDDDPGVRTQAIDLLIQSNEPEVAGVLQELLRREENSYVRSRSQHALSAMKASVGTF